MRKILAFLLPFSVLINPNADCFADVIVNPITVTPNSGNTTFSTSSSGTANYVVSVNSAVTPINVPLVFQLNDTGAASGLVATQITTGEAPCIGMDTLCGSTFSLLPGDSCCLAFSLTSQISGNYSLLPKVSTSPSTYSGQAASGLPISVVTDTTPTLHVSKNELALSITGLTLNGKPSGQSRMFVVSNTGSVPVEGIDITEPSWPTDTSMSTSCNSTLAVGHTCNIIITPGSAATSNCTTGSVPAPGVITLSANGITPINLNVVILGYGCIYQDGYIFSMNETTLPTISIGGTVAALEDQPNDILWSSNGRDANSVSYDIIPGIGNTSTSSSGTPTFEDFSTYFHATYSGTLGLSSDDFNQCDGKTNGRCNTTNIVTFYNYYQTNYGVGTTRYTPSVAPTPKAYYAAGVCDDYDSGNYQDWYLPTVCELTFDDPHIRPEIAGCGLQENPLMQNIEQNLFLIGVGNITSASHFWSSTEFMYYNPETYAWSALMYYFSFPGGGDKKDQTKIRCVRALTF